MNPCKIQNGYLYLSKHESLSDWVFKKWASRETKEAAHVCYSSSKADKNLGNRACKQIANAFVTVDTSLWHFTLWYFLANSIVFKTLANNHEFVSFSSTWYMQHMSCLPWTAGPWTLSPPHRALLCSPAELAKAKIKPKPQAKVNSPCWWHLGWWPCQRWLRGILWAHHRGCLRAGRIPPLNCSNTDELLFVYAFRESE